MSLRSKLAEWEAAETRKQEHEAAMRKAAKHERRVALGALAVRGAGALGKAAAGYAAEVVTEARKQSADYAERMQG